LVPNFCTWAAGSALSTTGRTQAAGGQAASGTQVSPRVAQQPYCCRHCVSRVQVGAQIWLLPIGTHAPSGLLQAEESAQVTVQKPPGKRSFASVQPSPLGQSALVVQASPSTPGVPFSCAQVPFEHRCVTGQSLGKLQGMSLEQAASRAPSKTQVESLLTDPPVLPRQPSGPRRAFHFLQRSEAA